MARCSICDKEIPEGQQFCNPTHETIAEISTLLKELKTTHDVSLTYKINSLEKSIGRDVTDFTSESVKQKFGL